MENPASARPRPGVPAAARLRGTAIALVVLAVVLGVVYAPVFLGRVLFFRDIARHTYPVYAFARAALETGQPPFWHPADGLGHAVFSSPLHGILYPPQWLAVLGSGSLARAITCNGTLHLFWGAAGMLLLARRLGRSVPGALVVAFAWALSGSTTAVWTTDSLLFVMPWFPWCALGAIALRRRAAGTAIEVARGLALAALPLALCALVGEIFQATLAAIFAAAVALLPRPRSGADASPSPPPAGLARAWTAPAACLLAAALAAALFVPLARGVGESARAGGLSRERAEKWSLHPLRLVELAAPGAMGDPYLFYPGGELTSDGSVDDRSFLYGVYLGAAALALALAGLGRRAPGEPAVDVTASRVLVALAAVSVMLALGRHTPLHALFRWLAPVFLYHRTPEKFVCLAVPFLALAAGFGADRVLGGFTPAERSLRVLGLVAALVAVAAGTMALPREPVALTVRAGALHGAAAVAGVLLASILSRRLVWSAGVTLVAVVAADLAVAALPLLVFGPAEVLDRRPAMAAAILGERPVAIVRPRVYRDPRVDGAVDRFVRRGDIADLERRRIASLRPSTLTGFGLASVPGYVAEPTPAFQQVWTAGRTAGVAPLRLMSIDYAVLPARSLPPPAIDGLTYLPARGPPGAALYRVDAPLPRAYVAGAASVLDHAAALAALYSPDVVAGRRVLLTPGAAAPEAAPPSALDGRSSGRCTITRFTNTRIEANCESAGPAHAVFVEQYAPGWTATVGGRPAPVLRANLLLRAVPLPGGRHPVILAYRAPGLSLGLAISAVAWLALGALGVAWIRSRRARPKPARP